MAAADATAAADKNTMNASGKADGGGLLLEMLEPTPPPPLLAVGGDDDDRPATRGSTGSRMSPRALMAVGLIVGGAQVASSSKVHAKALKGKKAHEIAKTVPVIA
eukprot:SAG22_NODE_2531_length_2469_cov_1.339662_2_plen_105_part_00